MTLPGAEQILAIKAANHKKHEKKKTKKAFQNDAVVEDQLNDLSLVDPIVVAPLVDIAASSAREIPQSSSWDSLVHCDLEAEEKKNRVEEANKNWPWLDLRAPSKLLTQAPFALNEFNAKRGYFTLPAASQNSLLMHLPHGMEHPILSILFQYHSTASKFAATCQAAFHMVSQFIDHWDNSHSDYLCCDKDLNKIPKKDEIFVDASVGKVVVVTPFRSRTCRPVHHDIQMYALHRMTMAMSNFADRFETLHLHRIPLLTVNLLSIIVPHMRNLKMLGIYRCELLHVGCTLPLLKILRSNRGAGKTSNIALDFFPRFHIGPACRDRSVYSGSFGVTWDNFVLDSRLAIWELVTKILPVAQEQGVDLISKDAAFRQWLDRSPCWRVEDTIRAILSETNIMTLLCQVDFPRTKGRICMMKGGQRGYTTLNPFTCRSCRVPVAGLFFDFDEHMMLLTMGSRTPVNPTAGYTMTCLGCKLTSHLNNETDHHKDYKARLAELWLTKSDSSPNDDDLEYALRPDVRGKAMTTACSFEIRRGLLEAREKAAWDKKGLAKKGWKVEETQRERGKEKRAAEIWEKDPTGYW